jgi:hypothetical protein
LNVLLDASAPDAAYYNSAGRVPCCEGTRKTVFDHISNWIKDDRRHRIYWLNGVAGSGKSAIAQTVAEACAHQRQLAASFFFSRDKANRNTTLRFFPTLARQLIASIPSTELVILEALRLESSKTIQARTLRDQLEMLMIKPLLELGRRSSSPVVLVIDALDECRDDDPEIEGAAEIITVFTSALSQYPDLPLRLFISSRPEYKIAERMTDPAITHMIRSLSLGAVNAQDDIRIFLQYRFDQIRRHRRKFMGAIVDPWPSPPVLDALVRKSSGLFVYASTIVNFVDTNRKNPVKQLDIVLNIKDHPSVSPLEPLYLLYKQILYESPYTEETRTLVETIVLLFDPLPIADIERLLGWDEGEGLLSLEGLHSVFLVPDGPGASIRIFHASLDEFLTTPSHPHEYAINSQERHTIIARICVKMLKTLKRDICDMGLDKFVGDMPDQSAGDTISTANRRYRREESIHGALRYACKYWAKHLSYARFDENIFNDLEDLGSKFILYWIEALSLIGDLDSARTSLNDAQKWLKQVGSPPNKSYIH